MKRSEMVKEISRMVELIREEDKNNTTPNHSEEYASLMLHRLEKAGMLPPNKEGGIVKFKADSGLSGINAMINSHKWESEDET